MTTLIFKKTIFLKKMKQIQINLTILINFFLMITIKFLVSSINFTFGELREVERLVKTYISINFKKILECHRSSQKKDLRYSINATYIQGRFRNLIYLYYYSCFI